jgi:hypothetical protein
MIACSQPVLRFWQNDDTVVLSISVGHSEAIPKMSESNIKICVLGENAHPFGKLLSRLFYTLAIPHQLSFNNLDCMGSYLE